MNQQLPDDLAPFDLNVYGQALLTRGLVVNDAIAGIGLETFGFVWPLPQIWFDAGIIAALSTSWAAGASQTTITTWTESAGAGSSTVTVWTNEPRGGIWG